MTEPTTLLELFTEGLEKGLHGLSAVECEYRLRKLNSHWLRRHAEYVGSGGRSEQPHPKFGIPTAYDMSGVCLLVQSKMELARAELKAGA